MSDFNWDNAAWRILKLLMQEKNYLIQHQISSYNLFLDKGLRNVIEQFNPISLNYDYVTKQQFYRFKEDSKFYNDENCEWVEYIELTDLYKMFKDEYSIVNNQITTLDLSEHLNISSEKESLLQTEFKEFIEEHLEFKTLDVNKHRYDEIEIFFNSITPPTIYENNGSQKKCILMKLVLEILLMHLIYM